MSGPRLPRYHGNKRTKYYCNKCSTKRLGLSRYDSVEDDEWGFWSTEDGLSTEKPGGPEDGGRRQGGRTEEEFAEE